MISLRSTVALIPFQASTLGTRLATDRLHAFSDVHDHLIDCMKIEERSGSLRLLLDPERIDLKILRQTKRTNPVIAPSRRKQLITPEEAYFLETIDAVVHRFASSFLIGSPKEEESWCLWATLNGSELLFSADSPLPPFFGLAWREVLGACVERVDRPVPERLEFSPAPVDDLLGAGVMTALRVYLGKESLGPERADLVPHRLSALDVTEIAPQPSESVRRLLLIGGLNAILPTPEF